MYKYKYISIYKYIWNPSQTQKLTQDFSGPEDVISITPFSLREKVSQGPSLSQGLQFQLCGFFGTKTMSFAPVYVVMSCFFHVGLILNIIFPSSHILDLLFKFYLMCFALLTSRHFFSFKVTYDFFLLFNCYILFSIFKCLE